MREHCSVWKFLHNVLEMTFVYSRENVNGDWNMTPYWTVPLKSIKKDERNDTDGQVTSGVAVLELRILRAVNLFE